MTLTVSISDFEQMTMMKHRDKPLEKQYLQLTNCFITLSSQVRVPPFVFIFSECLVGRLCCAGKGGAVGGETAECDGQEGGSHAPAAAVTLQYCSTAVLQPVQRAAGARNTLHRHW